MKKVSVLVSVISAGLMIAATSGFAEESVSPPASVEQGTVKAELQQDKAQVKADREQLKTGREKLKADVTKLRSDRKAVRASRKHRKQDEKKKS